MSLDIDSRYPASDFPWDKITDPDSTREILHSPFVLGGRKWATDGRVAASVATDEPPSLEVLPESSSNIYKSICQLLRYQILEMEENPGNYVSIQLDNHNLMLAVVQDEPIELCGVEIIAKRLLPFTSLEVTMFRRSACNWNNLHCIALSSEGWVFATIAGTSSK